MFKLFSNQANLMSVFSTYSAVEAIQVKKNIQYALSNMGIPSPELLAQMQSEGFSIDEFDNGKACDSAIMATQAVLLANIKAVFLSADKLLGMLKGFALAEKIKIKTILLDSMAHLRLPSEALLAQMAQEGLVVESTPSENADKVLSVKNKLSQALSAKTEVQQKAVKEHLQGQEKANLQPDDKKLKVTQVRNKLATLLQNETSKCDDLLVARKKQRLHNALQNIENANEGLPTLKVVGSMS